MDFMHTNAFTNKMCCNLCRSMNYQKRLSRSSTSIHSSKEKHRQADMPQCVLLLAFCPGNHPRPKIMPHSLRYYPQAAFGMSVHSHSLFDTKLICICIIQRPNAQVSCCRFCTIICVIVCTSAVASVPSFASVQLTASSVEICGVSVILSVHSYVMACFAS